MGGLIIFIVIMTILVLLVGIKILTKGRVIVPKKEVHACRYCKSPFGTIKVEYKCSGYNEWTGQDILKSFYFHQGCIDSDENKEDKKMIFAPDPEHKSPVKSWQQRTPFPY